MLATRPDELTVAEAARALGVAPITIRRWCAAGRLAGRRVANHWFVPARIVAALRSRRRQVARLAGAP